MAGEMMDCVAKHKPRNGGWIKMNMMTKLWGKPVLKLVTLSGGDGSDEVCTKGLEGQEFLVIKGLKKVGTYFTAWNLAYLNTAWVDSKDGKVVLWWAGMNTMIGT